MSPGLRTRRIREEHELLEELQAANPGVFTCGKVRLTDEGDEIEATLAQTAAIVDLADLTGWRFVAFEELRVGLIQRIRQNLGCGIVPCFCQVLQ